MHSTFPLDVVMCVSVPETLHLNFIKIFCQRRIIFPHHHFFDVTNLLCYHLMLMGILISRPQYERAQMLQGLNLLKFFTLRFISNWSLKFDVTDKKIGWELKSYHKESLNLRQRQKSLHHESLAALLDVLQPGGCQRLCLFDHVKTDTAISLQCWQKTDY